MFLFVFNVFVFVFTIIQVRLILNKKKGFVKLALRCGVSLVPTFSFGEAAIYDKVRDSWRVKYFLIACVLTAGEQGGFRSEEHPGLSDFNSWVCSGRLPRSRHLPVQFWNCPTQVSGKHLGFKNNHELGSRKPITLVVGAPIPAKQIANPSEEDVEKLHAKYVRHLQRLYKEHNPYPEIKLVIG